MFYYIKILILIQLYAQGSNSLFKNSKLWYIGGMAITTLVAGKDMPACTKFADGLVQRGRYVVVSGPESTDDEDTNAEDAKSDRQQKLMGKASGVATVEWNKNSPISSRTFLLSAETIFESLDEVVMYFDEELFASRADQVDIEECARGCDEMVLSYQYLTLEVLRRFEHRHNADEPGKLIYLIKEGPSAADAVRAPSLRNGAYSIASPVVAAASSAFIAFTENIVALYGDLPYVEFFLVRGDKTQDLVANDTAFAKWLGGYIDDTAKLGEPSSAKKSLNWIKPGTKVQQGNTGGFSLFGKK